MERILQLRIITEANEHGEAFFSGILSQEYGLQCLGKRVNRIVITREPGDGNEIENIVLFAGQIEDYTVKKEGGIYYFSAKCLSADSVFDREKKCRSFQDTKMTYGQLLRQISGEGRAVLVTKNSGVKIPHPYIQYQETDWEFIKRIAGRLETVLIPDICHLYPQVSVGMVQGKTYQIQESEDIEIEKDIKNWRCLHGSTPMSNSFSLKIKGNLEMNLGDKVVTNGIKYAVLKKEILLSNGILSCDCWIGKEQIKLVVSHNNCHLCGLRLSGIVKAVSGEKMKVSLDIDKPYEVQELYEFTYLPVTGNGMYAMPVPGSIVHLYFPDDNEKNAFVVDCLSTMISEGKSPDDRYLSEDQKKVIELLPAVIHMGTSEEDINILDKNGVDIISDKKVSLRAKGDIILKNGGFLNMQSKAQIHLENGMGGEHYIHLEGVECTIKTEKFLTSDAGRKAEQVMHFDPKMAWRAAEAAKNTIPKVLGSIPASTAEGIGGKVLGGIPGFAGDGLDLDISKIAGVKIGGD